MEVRQVDPRTLTMEIEDVTFRVYFWDEDRSTSDEWELVGVQLDAADAWARQNAAGRSYSLLVCFEQGSEVCGIRLIGADPTRVPDPINNQEEPMN